MGSELFCGDELLSIKRDAMNPKLRFYVKMEFSPFSSDKDLSMAPLLANSPGHLNGDPNTKLSDKVLEKISLPLEFGFTVIHKGGKKFEFEPILPFKELIDSLAKWVAEKIVYPKQKESEKTTLWQDMKKFYEEHKVQVNAKLAQAGVIEHLGELTINLELTANFSAIKKIFTNLMKGLKAKIKDALVWLKGKFSKFKAWIKGNNDVEVEKNLEMKIDNEAEGKEIEHDNTILNEKITSFEKEQEKDVPVEDSAGAEEILETDAKLNFE